MFANALKTMWRSLARNKLHTTINICGLTLGIGGALIIFSIIRFELSFDLHHDDAERIYRIVRVKNAFGSISHDPGIPYPLRQAMREDIPELELLALTDSNIGSPVISIERGTGETARFLESTLNVSHVEPTYFGLFSYTWLAGSPEGALPAPNTAVLSKSLAKKYFGTTDVVGRVLHYNETPVQITGIVDDPPENTDLPFHFFRAFDSSERGNDSWSSTATNVQIFVRLRPGVPADTVERRLADLVQKYYDAEDAQTVDFNLQPLREQHFDVRYDIYSHRTVSKRTLAALGAIGIALLLTACINFINLGTALAARRAREVGVRKALGSSRARLIAQFIGETAFLTGCSIFAAVAVAELTLGILRQLAGFQLVVNPIQDPMLLFYLFCLFVVVTLGAGAYPALYLSRLKPVETLRGRTKMAYGKGLRLRKGLVIAQFAITQALILSALVIGSQLRYLLNAEMGFNRELVIEVDLPSNEESRLHALKREILRIPAVRAASYSNTGTASNSSWGGIYRISDGDDLREGNVRIKFVDEDFFQTYELELLHGKNVIRGDTLGGYVVNETLVRDARYGGDFSAILHKPLEIWGRKAPVIGVVRDFSTTSLHSQVPPAALTLRNRYGQIAARIDGADIPGTMAAIEAAWTRAFPEAVYSATFLDETVEGFYEDEQRTATLIEAFTVLAVFIGCLGLFGLVSYMAARRTKEIGVRKVLGAHAGHILALFGKEFACLILIAFAVAAPVSAGIMGGWLNDFAYRIDIGLGIYATVFSVSIALAALTIAAKSLQAATTQPVEALRSE